MPFDDVGDGVLGDAEVSGDPAVAPPVVDGMEHLRGEPVRLGALAGLTAEFLAPCSGGREDRHGSRLGGLAVTLSHAFQGGFSVSPRISVHWRRYADKDPLFRKTRSDRLARLSVNLLHRALQVRGFAPYIGYFYEWNRSNIPINAYRNHGAVLGISRTF